MRTVPERRRAWWWAAACVLTATTGQVAVEAQGPREWNGRVSFEWRGFFEAAETTDGPRAPVAIAAEAEYFQDWGRDTLLVIPFVRIDSSDAERTHADVRELMWRSIHDTWEFRAGIGRVFWGAVESQHLVDIVNQTDFVENMDAEDKLGQPTIALTLQRRWGHVDMLVLPGFRERTFPGARGRLQFPVRVARELTQYEAPSGTAHVDAAVRWSHTLAGLDLGISQFRGTGREPLLLPATTVEGDLVLLPRYVLVNQTGVDVQAVSGAWLWKLEAISRGGQGDRFGQGGRFAALTGGFEYTFADVRGSGRDVGVLVEYLVDSRQRRTTTPFDDDVFIGVRVEMNDTQSTRLLAGAIVDRLAGTTLVGIEGSRRLRDHWTVNFDVRAFAGLRPDDYLYGFRRDSHVQLEVRWFF